MLDFLNLNLYIPTMEFTEIPTLQDLSPGDVVYSIQHQKLLHVAEVGKLLISCIWGDYPDATLKVKLQDLRIAPKLLREVRECI